MFLSTVVACAIFIDDFISILGQRFSSNACSHTIYVVAATAQKLRISATTTADIWCVQFNNPIPKTGFSSIFLLLYIITYLLLFPYIVFFWVLIIFFSDNDCIQNFKLFFEDNHQRQLHRSCELMFVIPYWISLLYQFNIIMLLNYITRFFVLLITVALIQLQNEDFSIYFCKASSLICQYTNLKK